MIEDLYNQALDMNKKAFEAGLFDAAYHALACAFYFARMMDTIEPLQNVSKVAADQLARIDKSHPEYAHSTASVAAHDGQSIFLRLSRQARTIVSVRELYETTKNYL
jgi:hypothetical protein